MYYEIILICLNNVICIQSLQVNIQFVFLVNNTVSQYKNIKFDLTDMDQ